MPDRTCNGCGSVFAPRLSVSVYCSRRCLDGSPGGRAKQREQNERYAARGGTRRWTVTCQACGVTAAVSGPDVKFCSQDCYELWLLDNPDSNPRKRPRTERSTSTELVHLGSLAEFPDRREVVEGQCRYCRTVFAAPRYRSKLYCDAHCADLFKKWGRPRQHDDGRNWQILVSGPCSWCNENFTAHGIDGAARPQYCSKRCSATAGKSRRGRFLVPPFVRQRIYERDGFVCQLCSVPVDMTLGPSDVWGATLDHVIPQSHQLIPDHSPRNLRLAHRYCNSIRGDLSFIDDSFFEEAS